MAQKQIPPTTAEDPITLKSERHSRRGLTVAVAAAALTATVAAGWAVSRGGNPNNTPRQPAITSMIPEHLKDGGDPGLPVPGAEPNPQGTKVGGDKGFPVSQAVEAANPQATENGGDPGFPVPGAGNTTTAVHS